MSTFYLTKVTVVTVPRMSCCCWSGVWTQNYTVWLKFCHFPNCKTVTRNWILFVTRLTRLLGGFIVLGLNRTWIHSNFLNIWTIANPVTVVRNHLQSVGSQDHASGCVPVWQLQIPRDTWHMTLITVTGTFVTPPPRPRPSSGRSKWKDWVYYESRQLGELNEIYVKKAFDILSSFLSPSCSLYDCVAVLYLYLLLHWPALERWRVLRW